MHTIFDLNEMELEQVRELAKELKIHTTKKMDEFLHDEEIRGRLYITDNEIRIMTVNDRGEAEVTPTDIDLTDVPM